jgi:hypothetical protein
MTRLVKEPTAGDEALRASIERVMQEVRKALASTAHETFNYSGFHIWNPERFAEVLCMKTLRGLDYLRGLLRKRGVENLIEGAVSQVNLVLDAGATAFFHSTTRELTLSVPELSGEKPSRIVDSFAGETVLHEFGHYVHRVFLKGEAAEAWNAPWEGIADAAEWKRPTEGARDPRLEALEIPTDYGRTDKYEDFAETFMLFVASPEKLSPTAKFRMQRALSLSGLYGKPVMRLAELNDRVVRRYTSASRAKMPVGSKTPYLFNLDPHALVFTETGQDNVSTYEGDRSKPILVYEDKEGNLFVLDGHHRTLIARKENRRVRGVVMPEHVYRKFVREGVHQSEMFREFARYSSEHRDMVGSVVRRYAGVKPQA